MLKPAMKENHWILGEAAAILVVVVIAYGQMIRTALSALFG